jgi:hypothetical protein
MPKNSPQRLIIRLSEAAKHDYACQKQLINIKLTYEIQLLYQFWSPNAEFFGISQMLSMLLSQVAR